MSIFIAQFLVVFIFILKMFGCFVFSLILVGAICTIIFTSKINQYPCIKYTNTDLASTISQSCLGLFHVE